MQDHSTDVMLMHNLSKHQLGARGFTVRINRADFNNTLYTYARLLNMSGHKGHIFIHLVTDCNC